MEYGVGMNDEWMYYNQYSPSHSITLSPLRTVPPAAGSQLTQAPAPVLLTGPGRRTPAPETEETRRGERSLITTLHYTPH